MLQCFAKNLNVNISVWNIVHPFFCFLFLWYLKIPSTLCRIPCANRQILSLAWRRSCSHLSVWSCWCWRMMLVDYRVRFSQRCSRRRGEASILFISFFIYIEGANPHYIPVCMKQGGGQKELTAEVGRGLSGWRWSGGRGSHVNHK